MTKQKEIREGVWKILDEFDNDPAVDWAWIILSYLASQGVVMKVDRELPRNPYRMNVDEGEWLGFQVALDRLVGYVAVEPLIEEK